MLFFSPFPTWDQYLSARVYSSLTFLSTPASQSKCSILHIIKELIYESTFTLGVNWRNFLYCENINISDNLKNHFLWNCIKEPLKKVERGKKKTKNKPCMRSQNT